MKAQGEQPEKGEEQHESLARDLDRILHREAKAAQWESLVMYFALVASFVAVFGLTVLERVDLRFAGILSVLALIWLLAATYLLYRAEKVTAPEERLVWERLILVFAMGAATIALFSLSSTFLVDGVLAFVLEAVALVWLVGASFFLYKSLRGLEEARRVRSEARVGEAPIAYVDNLRGASPLLVSEEHGVRGRPDLVLQEDGAWIPVEVKTGRVPRGPLFSHILQVAAYCLLVEESYGSRPPYGLLRYGDVVHEIEYTEELQGLLLSKLREMREVAETGEAHRNHRRPGKCASCSRRHACPERLA